MIMVGGKGLVCVCVHGGVSTRVCVCACMHMCVAKTAERFHVHCSVHLAYVFSYLFLQQPYNRDYHYPHFTKKKLTERVTCSRPPNNSLAKPGCRSRKYASES